MTTVLDRPKEAIADLSPKTGGITLVGWDADRVMYAEHFTTTLARQNALPPQPYLQRLLGQDWFSREDVEQWLSYRGKHAISNVAEIAEMLTDFHYRIVKLGQPIITTKQTIEGKNLLLEGLTIEQIERISDRIVYTPGLLGCVEEFRRRGLHQTLFSNSVGPHIVYQGHKLGLDASRGVNPIVEYRGKEFEYHADAPRSARLTGKVTPLDKAQAFFDYIEAEGFDLSGVAVIDDSESNVESVLVPVQKAGGVAVGFNVTDAHRPVFERHGIPMIRGNDLTLFKEIVLDPRKINIYCD